MDRAVRKYTFVGRCTKSLGRQKNTFATFLCGRFSAFERDHEPSVQIELSKKQAPSHRDASIGHEPALTRHLFTLFKSDDAGGSEREYLRGRHQYQF